MLGYTHAEALAEPMAMIEPDAHARALLHGDPSQVLMAAVLLGKPAKPKLTGRELAKAQREAWRAMAKSRKGAKPKKTRR